MNDKYAQIDTQKAIRKRNAELRGERPHFLCKRVGPTPCKECRRIETEINGESYGGTE